MCLMHLVLTMTPPPSAVCASQISHLIGSRGFFLTNPRFQPRLKVKLSSLIIRIRRTVV